MIKVKVKNNKGFVILFAVTLASILLAIALGISNIAINEVNFSTSVKDSDNAFYAADTGAECALYNDKTGSNAFLESGGSTTITCLNNSSIGLTPSVSGLVYSWSFTIANMSGNGGSCAKVTLARDFTNPATPFTTLDSRGYNVGDGFCNSSNANRTEREVQLTYGGGAPLPAPIAWWKFDEGSGTTAADSSGNGYTGTLSGSPVWVAGKINGALSTDTGNGSSIVQVPSVTIGSNWTAAWWSSFPLANGSYRTMFRNSADDHQVLVDPGGSLGVFDNKFTTGFHSSGYNVNTLSGWHHIAAVGSSGTTTFYIDGASVGSSSYESTSNIDYVGNYQAGSQNWGIFDDVRIYNQALTQANIVALYNSGNQPSPAPVVTISANPTAGTVNVVNPQLTWSVTNQSPLPTCTASGDWSGSKNANGGTEQEGVLSSVKTYTYTLTCTNSNGTGVGSASVTVSAGTTVPSLTTNAVTGISQTTATSGGNISSNGGATVTQSGVAWSTSANPTTASSHTTDGGASGSWSSNMSSLTASTLYHVRAYAINSVGTAYGNDVTFTTATAIVVPTVTTTTPATNIASTTATDGGTITSNGGATVTVSGIVWSTSANPTYAGGGPGPGQTTDGAASGSWSSNMSGLTASTTYHVRAYAANSAGTAYGADIQFTTAAAVLGNSASFVKTDATTQGNWHGVYGADGYNVISATQSYPSYVTVTPNNNLIYTWADSPAADSAPQALFKDAITTTSRIAATWYNNAQWTLDFNINDGASHQVAIYMLDWDGNGSRAQTVDVLDGTTNAVLDTRNVSNFNGGKYLVWNLSGHVYFRFTSTGSPNSVISGIFFR